MKNNYDTMLSDLVSNGGYSDYIDEMKKRKILYHSDFVEKGENFLAHYNHSHDKLGRFAMSNGSSGSNISVSDKRKIDRDLQSHSILKQTVEVKTKTSRKELRDRWTEQINKKYEESEKRKSIERKMSASNSKSSSRLEDELFDLYNDITKNHTNDNVDEYVDATIKDLGLDDTESIRNYIKDNYDPGWYDKSYEVRNTKRYKKLKKIGEL